MHYIRRFIHRRCIFINTMNEKKESWFKGQIQFLAWVIAVTIAVITPILTSQNDIKGLTKDVNEIKTARAESWKDQKKVNDEIVNKLQDIGECLAVVKEKLQIK